MLAVNTCQKNHYPTAIMLMLLASVFVAVSAVFGKLLGLSLVLPALIFLRFGLSALILWWVALITRVPTFSLKSIRSQGIRAVFVVICQYAFFYCLIHSSVMLATLLFMTSPLFAPLIVRVAHGATIQRYQWVSLVMGFIGVLFALNISQDNFHWYALVGLMSGFFSACSQISFHNMSKQAEGSNTDLILYMYTIATFIAIIPALFFCHLGVIINKLTLSHNSLSVMLLLIVLAISSISNQTLKGRAYRKIDEITLLTPIFYTAVIFSAIFDRLFFHVSPTWTSLLGAFLIIISVMLLVFIQSFYALLDKITFKRRFTNE